MYDQKKNNELYHYGVKGMKWGVIRANRKSKAQRDTEKLANVANRYYTKSNDINALKDAGVYVHDKEYKNLNKYRKKADKMINKLNKKYKNVSVIPEFEKNGYVVKRTEASLVKLDRKGRVRSINNTSTPIETFNDRFGGKKERATYVKKRNAILNKYDNKIKNAKTESEKELLEFDLLDELDRLDGID